MVISIPAPLGYFDGCCPERSLEATLVLLQVQCQTLENQGGTPTLGKEQADRDAELLDQATKLVSMASPSPARASTYLSVCSRRSEKLAARND